MTKNIKLKEDIHKINGLIGRMGFSIEELFELKENDEEITKEHLDEIQTSFEEFKEVWKNIRTNIL